MNTLNDSQIFFMSIYENNIDGKTHEKEKRKQEKRQ